MVQKDMAEQGLRISMLTASVKELGGAEAMVRALADGLAGRGHAVQVISLDTEAVGSATRFGQPQSVTVNSRATDRYADRASRGGLFKAWWQMRCLWNPVIEKQLLDTLKAHRPDVIHTHKVRGFPRGLWPMLKDSTDCPVLHTCHDIELLTPMHTLPVPSTNPMSRTLQLVYQLSARRPSVRTDAMTAPSEFLLDLHRASGLFQGVSNHRVPNFTDIGLKGDPPRELTIDQFSPDERPLNLLFIGRLVLEKGVLDLCDAVERLNRQRRRFTLTIAGDGPLQERIQDRQAGDPDVIFSGSVRGREKQALFDHSSVVVVPSRSDEAFGLVAAEAICRFRPVLASDRGGLPEVVRDGVSGWIFNGRDPGGLQQALEGILKERQRLPVYSRSCREEASRFHPDRALDQYEAIYREAIDGSPQPSGQTRGS
jgi:glycosyltransferase involved in cell wall biosynthesis